MVSIYTRKRKGLVRRRTRAAHPRVAVHDVDLAGRVHEAEEFAGDDGDGVFFVVDVGQGKVRVDVVGEGLVADLDSR